MTLFSEWSKFDARRAAPATPLVTRGQHSSRFRASRRMSGRFLTSPLLLPSLAIGTAGASSRSRSIQTATHRMGGTPRVCLHVCRAFAQAMAAHCKGRLAADDAYRVAPTQANDEIAEQPANARKP
jgi:hypothetical protein